MGGDGPAGDREAESDKQDEEKDTRHEHLWDCAPTTVWDEVSGSQRGLLRSLGLRNRTRRAAVLLALTVGLHAQAQEPAARLVWTRRLDQPIVAARWSARGDCVAVATATTVHVFGADGVPLWDWNYRQTNRFLRVESYRAFALSPTCDAVVLQGDPSYRYVLSADRNGGRQLLKTTGTPLSVRFDLTGQTVAVVTGASKAYLLSPALEVRWSGATASLPVDGSGGTGGAGRAG